MITQHLMQETLRYLGVHNAESDETLLMLIEQAITSVEAVAHKRYAVSRTDCRVEEKGVWIHSHFIDSAALAKHLSGCKSVFILATTLGAAVDRLLRRDTVIQPSVAVAEQAAAAALIEHYTDEVCQTLQASLKSSHLLPRFSPGYSDFSLEEQDFLLQFTEAYKRIGLTHTQSFMLTPAKSVTAIIGITNGDVRCYASGCQTCSKTDCAFRK